jgi:hypothetical protein
LNSSKFSWLDGRLRPLLRRLRFADNQIKVESKGALSYKAEWRENPDSHLANLTYTAQIGFDPLFGIKAEAAGPPTAFGPVFTLCTMLIGLDTFINVRGEFAAMGGIARDDRGRNQGQADLGGKVVVAAGARLNETRWPPVRELSVAGESGLSLRAKLRNNPNGPGVLVKDPMLNFDGLVIKVSFKTLGGRIGYSGKSTILAPEVLYSGSDFTLLGN